MTSANHYPDGLDEQAIDRLIAEVAAELAATDVPASTPERRRTHQRLGSVVRVLRTLPTASAPAKGTEAA